MTPERIARARALIELTRTTPYGAVASAGDTEAVDLLDEAVGSIEAALEIALEEDHAPELRPSMSRCVGCVMERALKR